MIRKILTVPHHALSTVCKDIEDTGAIRAVVKDMIDTLLGSGNGVGLAAPQIGWTIRVIAFRSNTKSTDVTVMVNPIITRQKKPMMSMEGCLSVPGKQARRRRYDRIRVSWVDLSGQRQERSFSGPQAIVIQHEVDHLNGVTILSQ